ncbi:hypothetical protein MBLNU13_g06195t1 [Cladosporium sp. NU13]
MPAFRLEALAYPGVVSLVSFLAFTSQWLFYNIQPGPLRKGEAYIFNALVFALLVCYTRTCYTDPGRIPSDWHQSIQTKDECARVAAEVSSRQRYCRKCEMPKPPRAHHCKICKRCIMKMDHHCVWTANCISHITLPHFLRFLSYAVAAMLYLQYFLFIRCALLWKNRNLPSYLGPSALQLSHLFILVVVNGLVLFGLILLLGRSVWGLALNITTIEGWEVERHHALLRRARVLGGQLDGPDGTKVRIEHQEFPWDIGILSNFRQAMGTWNLLAWAWPFAASPSINSGLVYEHNEIDDPSKPWPPPDPDRVYRAPRAPPSGDGFTQSMDVDEFRKRQQADLQRHQTSENVVRRRPFHERYAHLDRSVRASDHYNDNDDDDDAITTNSDDEADEEIQSPSILNRRSNAEEEGEEAWRNKEGERLADFGLDEDAEFYDEDNLPLAEIMRRRKVDG